MSEKEIYINVVEEQGAGVRCDENRVTSCPGARLEYWDGGIRLYIYLRNVNCLVLADGWMCGVYEIEEESNQSLWPPSHHLSLDQTFEPS